LTIVVESKPDIDTVQALIIRVFTALKEAAGLVDFWGLRHN
jgi:hypothetical protein